MKKSIAIILCFILVMALTVPAAALSTVAVKGIQLETDKISLQVGQSFSMKVTLTPKNTTQKLLTYSTANKNVASIDTKGKITATGAGKTTITVYTANKSIFAKAEVTVTAAAKKPVTLRFSWWGGDARAQATLAVVKKFQEKYPYITIKAEYGGSDGYNDKLSTQLSAGTAPDVIQLANAMPQTYKAQGADYFVDLTKEGFDFSKFSPDYLSKANNGNCDGIQVGIPTGVAGAAFLINKDLADKIGVSSIASGATWYDLIVAGKKVQQYSPDTYLLCMNTNYIVNLIVKPFHAQLTGNKTIVDETTKKLNATPATLEKCMNLVQELYKNKVIAPASYSAAYPKDTLQTDPNWIAGKYVAAMPYISTIEVMTAANKNPHYVMGDLPVYKRGELIGWSTNCPQIMVINKKSKNVKEALMFLDYLFNDPASMEILGTVRSIPPTAEARRLLAEKGLMNSLLQQSADISMKNKGLIADHWTEASEGIAILEQAVESVGYGKSTPAQAAADLYTALQNIVGK
jgi:oligogalacturonide transport system substrate-binding protein